MRKISAEYIYTMAGAPLKDSVIVLDDSGTILEIGPISDYADDRIEVYEGVIIPGFINAHCHLELSHMLGKVNTGTKLIPFISNVVKFRDIAEETIQQAIKDANQEMFENGIVAVGDISNKTDTAATKQKSQIRYYTFVEMFDFLQEDWAEKTYQDYKVVFEGQADGDGNRKSAVPHAPYSVSKNLFTKINALNAGKGTVSIHNQETSPENELFLGKSGDFLNFFKAFNISIEAFEANGKTAIHYALENMDPACRTLFVHNTLSTVEDIQAAHAWGQNGIYWATCPNANLFIENRLPNYQHFLDTAAKVCVGTDSLTSNWQLSVLEEIKTIARFQNYVPFATLLQWATINGAEALQYDADLGSIEKGKRPGINILTGLKGDSPDNFQFCANTQTERLV